jgi:transposase
MGLGPLLLALERLQIERIRFIAETVILDLSSTAGFCCCPECGQRSSRIHSHYCRHLHDLPAQGRMIQLNLRVRRFFCDHPDCPKQTFAERLPEVTQPHARRTCRLAAAMQEIAFATGGEAGARLAGKLAVHTSPDTLLRLMRKASPDQQLKTPAVLGVDDWSIHRGQSYGTILCDLELHKTIDLLPERSSQRLAAWLSDHPGIQIISRDRGGDYARGAAMGAPHAVQVADRWHLLCNLSQSLQEALDHQHGLISQASKAAAGIALPAPSTLGGQTVPEHPSLPHAKPASAPVRPTREQRRQEQRREKRLARYQQVKQLQAQGLSLQQIRAQLKLSRWAVRHFARARQFPERASSCPHRRKTELDRFGDYLWQRWEQGCHNSIRLWGDLKEKGYTGSPYSVRRRVAAWREPNVTDQANPSSPGATPRVKQLWKPSSRAVAWLLLEPDRADSLDKQAFLAALHRLWPELETSVDLVQEFRRMVREREHDSLEAWVELAQEKTIVPEVRRFASRLRKDWSAVIEAVKGTWSNGQVEGQINRLKLIKRQMYGRANLDLLRQRVLHGT